MEVSNGAFQHVDSVVLVASTATGESRRPLRPAPRWAARRAGHSRRRPRKPRLRSRASKTVAACRRAGIELLKYVPEEHP